MNKKWMFVVFILILLFAGLGVFVKFYKIPTLKPTVLATAYLVPSLVPSPFPVTGLECGNENLTTYANFEGAAGSIYGTLTITNTSDLTCNVTLGDTIKANYQANNVSTNYENNPPAQTFTLQPGDKVYSQIHYPNGPQCQSQILHQPITLSYESNTTKVDFEIFTITACIGNENTQIDIWPLSSAPIAK